MPKKIGGITLTPSQYETVKRCIAEIENVDNPHAACTASFKKSHTKKKGKWAKKKKKKR